MMCFPLIDLLNNAKAFANLDLPGTIPNAQVRQCSSSHMERRITYISREEVVVGFTASISLLHHSINLTTQHPNHI